MTAGPASARAAWRRLVPPGGFDVVDRGAADDARVQEWHERPCHGLARVPSTAADAVHDERPVSAAAPAAGGPRDGLSRHRATPHHPALRPQPCRVVRVASGTTRAEGTPDLLVLVTPDWALDAELVALA